MARETRIGIALMVLLVGVFGAIVYKKWNGRQPTALIAASEGSHAGTSESEPSGKEANGVKNATPSPISTASEENPFSQEDFAETSPFERQTPPPMAQAEPVTVSTAEQVFPFEEVGSPAANPPEARPTAPLPEEPTSLFADAPQTDKEPMVQAAPEQSERVADSSEVTRPISAASSPLIDDDPFAMTAESDATPEAESVMSPDAGLANIEPNDDPFASPIATQTPPVGDDSDPFRAGSRDVEEEMIASPSVATEVVRKDTDVFEDPFADAPSQKLDPTLPVPMPEDIGEVASGSSSPPESDSGLLTDSGAPQEFVPDESATAFAGFDEEFRPASEVGSNPDSQYRDANNDAIGATKADYHVVAENESYWTISKKVYGTPAYYHALAQFNIERIKDPNRLRAGWKVLTPAAGELKLKFPSLVASVPTGESSIPSAGASGKPGFFLDAQDRPSYRVGESDTLGGIAQVHLGRASRWVQIYELNRASIKDPKSIRPGTILRLPPDASRVRLVPEG